MILFNSSFSVDKSLTRPVFFSVIRKWLLSESFPEDILGQFISNSSSEDFVHDEYRYDTDAVNKSFIIDNYDDAVIVTFIAEYKINGCTSQTDYVLSDNGETHTFYCKEEQTFDKPATTVERQYVVPELIKLLFWEEFGGEDGDSENCPLPVTNEPYILSKQNLDVAKHIITSPDDYSNPIVYVSPVTETGYYNIDCDKLSKDLQGQAHVVVEKSPVVSDLIANDANHKNPYNGAVSIFGAGQDTINFLYDSDMNKKIVSTVYSLLENRAVPASLNPSELRKKYTLTRISKGDEGLVKLCEDMLAEKDSKIEQLKSELKDAKSRILALESKSTTLQDSFDNNDNVDKCLKFVVTEKDIYEQEISTVILKILRKEYESMQSDPNLNSTRKFHILSDILDHNFPCDADTRLIECIRSAFNDGTLTKEGIGRLQSSGFIVDKGKTHTKVVLGDDRYMMTVASSPSDSRTGINTMMDFIRLVFGR